MKEDTNKWLDELADFLTADAWSEERIKELLVNVWLDGHKEGEGK
jgi:Fe-S-cluster formation regulator IscX/YfhJ